MKTAATMHTIRLYGDMGRLFGRVHRVALDTNCPKEAVQYLRSQFPGVDAYLMGSKDRGVGFAVFAGKRNLAEGELEHPTGNDDIRIAPILMGSKNSGIFSIILGAVLVVVGVLGETYGQAFGGGVWGPIAMKMGIAMIAGGVVQLLTPMPKGLSSKDKPNNVPNYSFNGPINTQAQGNPVPLLYGRLKVGSAVISAGIDTLDTSYTPVTPGAGSGSMGGGGGQSGIANKFGANGAAL